VGSWDSWQIETKSGGAGEKGKAERGRLLCRRIQRSRTPARLLACIAPMTVASEQAEIIVFAKPIWDLH